MSGSGLACHERTIFCVAVSTVTTSRVQGVVGLGSVNQAPLGGDFETNCNDLSGFDESIYVLAL